MISLHGYVSAEPELGKPDTGGQVVYVLELAKRFSRLGRRVDGAREMLRAVGIGRGEVAGDREHRLPRVIERGGERGGDLRRA